MKAFIDPKISNPADRAGKKHKKLRIILAATVIVGLFWGSTAIIVDREFKPVSSVTVKRGPVTIKITETGELRAEDQVTISAANDKMILWMVPEGSWVEENDTLVIFESEKYVIARSEASSNVDVAKAEFQKALSELEAQMTKEGGARQNYESLAELAKKGYVMESEVEQARLSYLELKSRTKSFKAAVDVARANVVRAKRGVAQQDRRLRENIMLAPRAGLVVYAMMGTGETLKKVGLGMTPFEGMELMYLPDISSMLVDAEISEVDLARIKIGMPAEIRLDAYQDTVFTGEISSIADLAKRKISLITGKATGAKVFDVTVKVLAHDLRLKPGLTATVDVIVNKYDDVLYLPLESIFVDEQDQMVAYTKQKRKIKVRSLETAGIWNYFLDLAKIMAPSHEIIAQPIVIGDSNDRVAVIKEGLKEGQEILLVPPPSI
jgi:HlyD family secretion protein